MQRLLLFDSACSLCTQLARSIESETKSWLTARTLRDEKVQALLDRARPGWRWEPTLLEVDGDRVRAFTGFAMRARLFTGLGPRQAWRVAQLARRAGVPLVGIGLGRREFLIRGGTFLAGLLLWPRGGWTPHIPPDQGPQDKAKHPFLRL
jgi:predicted DCC family thiol-disulfide oxidoreductase YuxK